MPGITGIIGKQQKKKNERELQLMVKAMLHESFYSSGAYANDQLGVYAGWVCHDSSFSDCMPVWNEKESVVLIYFGENYTDLELFDQLKAKNHSFNRSNASYIIHLYEEKGIDFLKDLNGWFSGLLVDLSKKKVFLFNDRYGMQKIFYYEAKNAFYFSSEAKALLHICPELREIDKKGLGEFIYWNTVLEDRTLFKNIFLLPSASVWEIKPENSLKKGCYFKFEDWENQTWLEENFFYEKIKHTFSKILPRYFRSDQKIAISLTGGLDIRAVLANMKLPPGKYPCYTFEGIYRDCYDTTTARRVADLTQQTHQTLYLDKKFLVDFLKHLKKAIFITDGYSGIEGSCEIYLKNLAREIAPIHLTGNFGFGMLQNNKRTPRSAFPNEKLYNPDIAIDIQDAIQKVSELSKISTHPMINLSRGFQSPRKHGLLHEQSQMISRTPYLDNDLVALTFRVDQNIWRDEKYKLRLIKDGNPLLAKISSDIGFGGNKKVPLSTLQKLYYGLVLKTEYAYNEGMPQWLTKIDNTFRFLNLKKVFLGSHKITPFGKWYRDELADLVKCILLDEKSLTRPYLNRISVEQMVLSHTKGERNYTPEISKMLSLELIQRLLIEKYVW